MTITPTLPTFDHITFDEANHTYTAPDGTPLTSVTRVIKELQTPFDTEYWSARKAAERGVSKDVIIAEWEEKRRASAERGTRVHAYIHHMLAAMGGQPPSDPRFILSNLPEERAFAAFLRDAYDRGSFDVAPLALEYVIGDVELGIAGTVDALFTNPNYGPYYGDIYLFDWKTGGKFATSNRFQTLLPPFDDLDDCELNYYSLQVSLYALILRRAGLTALLMERAYIVHLASDGTYRTWGTPPDLPARMEAWLLERKAQLG